MVQSAGVVALAGAFGQMSVGPVVAVVPMVGVVVGPAVVAGAFGPVPMEVDSDEAMEVD